MLVALLRPAGADLARRWLATLLLVDEADRPALVAEVERRVARHYPRHAQNPSLDPALDPSLEVVHPPVQRDGYVEQTHVTYAANPSTRRAAKPAAKSAAKSATSRRAPAADQSPPARRVRSRK